MNAPNTIDPSGARAIPQVAMETGLLVELFAAEKQGVPHCAIVYAPELIPVARRAQPAFQGWRYLEGKDAPRDLAGGEAGGDALPIDLAAELGRLGLV